MSYIGTSKVGGMYLGDTKIGKAYLGDDLIYSSGPPPVVENPDCIRIDFTTTTDNYTFKFGYFVGNYTSYVELDGARVSFTTGSDNHFTVPTAGSHIVYIKPSQNWPSNYNFGYFTKCDYIRFPYNAATRLLCGITQSSWSNKWAKIDILDAAYWSRVKTNSYNVFSNADRIRVPVGAKQLYINNSAPQAVLNKMTEYNFNYTI